MASEDDSQPLDADPGFSPTPWPPWSLSRRVAPSSAGEDSRVCSSSVATVTGAFYSGAPSNPLRAVARSELEVAYADALDGAVALAGQWTGRHRLGSRARDVPVHLCQRGGGTNSRLPGAGLAGRPGFPGAPHPSGRRRPLRDLLPGGDTPRRGPSVRIPDARRRRADRLAARHHVREADGGRQGAGSPASRSTSLRRSRIRRTSAGSKRPRDSSRRR